MLVCCRSRLWRPPWHGCYLMQPAGRRLQTMQRMWQQGQRHSRGRWLPRPRLPRIRWVPNSVDVAACTVFHTMGVTACLPGQAPCRTGSSCQLDVVRLPALCHVATRAPKPPEPLLWLAVLWASEPHAHPSVGWPRRLLPDLSSLCTGTLLCHACQLSSMPCSAVHALDGEAGGCSEPVLHHVAECPGFCEQHLSAGAPGEVVGLGGEMDRHL